MGAEDKGISDAIRKLATAEAKIPMAGNIGSLNVSAAASVILYEAVRQRITK
jgi:23S rRNA (guanosine2251-2'-O)-methyltransferase